MKKRQKKKLVGYLIVVAILLFGALIPSLGIEGLPTWDSVFTQVGLRGGETDGLPLRVHFLDIGQGDCTLLLSGDSAVMIDGANRGNDKTITAYLRNQGVKKLDYL
ncbi:MAG: hypothetical protein FWG82_07220, partial [Oscillospiraceae bacterium]|nr:hypothetical protein [Oscillospiraceae bacterium]